jgi:hypothetical protein
MRTLTPDDVAGLCAIYPPNGTRSVDPSVTSGGSVADESCNPTPRHGFQSECAHRTQGGCAIVSGEAGGDPGAAVVAAALASLGIARMRKRAASTQPS